MSSWSADIDRYSRTKNFGDGSAVSEPVTRHLRGSAARDTTGYNIINGTSKDANGSKGVSAPVSLRASSSVRRPFDIVTNLSVRPGEESLREPRTGPARAAEAKPPRSYDIVSNDPMVGMERQYRGEDEAERARLARLVPRFQRQTDIISHRYYHRHDERVADDQARLQATIERKLIDSGADFNPVTQRFDDQTEQRDAAARGARDAELRDSVKKHTYRVSTLVERSEGHALDIVTSAVHNPQFVLDLDKRRERGVLQRVELRQRWEQQRDVEAAVQDVDATRRLNRFHPSKKPEWAGGSVVDPPTTKERLEAALTTKPVAASDAFREEGPRTTHERVLNAAPSVMNVAVATYEGRRTLLLPTLDRAAGRPVQRADILRSLKHSSS